MPFLHAASKLALIQVRRDTMQETQRKTLLRELFAKIREVMDALTPLVSIWAVYPLLSTAKLLDYHFCSLDEHQTMRELLCRWGLEAVSDHVELLALEWRSSSLRMPFVCMDRVE